MQSAPVVSRVSARAARRRANTPASDPVRPRLGGADHPCSLSPPSSMRAVRHRPPRRDSICAWKHRRCVHPQPSGSRVKHAISPSQRRPKPLPETAVHHRAERHSRGGARDTFSFGAFHAPEPYLHLVVTRDSPGTAARSFYVATALHAAEEGLAIHRIQAEEGLNSSRPGADHCRHHSRRREPALLHRLSRENRRRPGGCIGMVLRGYATVRAISPA